MKNNSCEKIISLTSLDWEDAAKALTYMWFPKYNVTSMQFSLDKSNEDYMMLKLNIIFVGHEKELFYINYVLNDVEGALITYDNRISANTKECVGKEWRKFLIKKFGKEYKRFLKASVGDETYNLENLENFAKPVDKSSSLC